MKLFPNLFPAPETWGDILPWTSSERVKGTVKEAEVLGSAALCAFIAAIALAAETADVFRKDALRAARRETGIERCQLIATC
jgi:hypothetical protein